MKKKNVMFPVLFFTLVFILSACAKANTKTGDSSDSVLKQIDALKDYQIVQIQHMTTVRRRNENSLRKWKRINGQSI
ncbi:MAG: hypothetical protein Q8930_16405 [Bacillota bacterium]|nr:hypothetical protein [Bacillota bacterium]